MSITSRRGTLIQLFEDPPRKYRPHIAWQWNHQLEAEELERQIKEMKEKGCGGFFIFPFLRGLDPAPLYLSEEWFRWVEYAVHEAQRLGIDAWLYDEDLWPSGMAGGRVMKDHPEYRMSSLSLAKEEKVVGPTTYETQVPGKNELIFVLAMPWEGKYRNLPETVLDLTPYVSKNRLKWHVPMGEWLIMIFVRVILENVGFFGSHVDYLNKDAIKCFIDLTHKAYVQRLQKYIGSVVPGVFTDEPAINFQPFYQKGAKVIPWTPKLMEHFKSIKNYDLKLCLPAIFHDVGPKTSKIRCDFYEVVTKSYVDAFFKQIYNYLSTLNGLLVGHILYEGELFPQVRNEGDFFRVTEYMHYPGVDFFEGTWPSLERRYPNNLCGPKFASSAGHVLGKPRVLSESFTAHGWKQNMRLLKQSSDWQLAMGANFFVHMAFWYSIQGHRKRQWPGASCHSTYWPFYKLFTDYLSRVCYMLSEGRHVSDVAVLYPVKSIWAHMNPCSTPLTKKIEEDFSDISETLSKLHHDYDYIDEESLQHSEMSQGTIRVRDEEYKLLVLPSLTTISLQTLEKIKEFYRGGGTILATRILPTESVERGSDRRVSEEFEKIFGVSPLQLLKDMLNGREQPPKLVRKRNRAGGSALFLISSTSIRQPEVREVVGKALKKEITPDVSITSEGKEVEDIVYIHRLKEGRHIYLFHNTSADKTCQAKISLREKGTPECWDSVSGRIKPLYRYNFNEGKTNILLRFHPLESYLLVLSRSISDKPHVVDADLHIDKISLKDGKLRMTTYTRVQGIHFAELAFKRKKYRMEMKIEAPLAPIQLSGKWKFKPEKLNAFPIREWSYRIETGPTQQNVEIHHYEAAFLVELRLPEARLLIDGPVGKRYHRGYGSRVWTCQQIYLNEEEITKFERGKYLDPYILEADVTRMIRQGENKLHIKMTSSPICNISAMEGPPILVGRFRLSTQSGKPVLLEETNHIETGSWVNQGYPHYSGTCLYEQEVEVPEEYLNRKLILKIDQVADMAEVWVNGKHVALLPWDPFKVDITPHIKLGKNLIGIRVTNSLHNIIENEPRPSGILGKTQIVPFEVVNNVMEIH